MDLITKCKELRFFYFKLNIQSLLKEKEGIALLATTNDGKKAWAEVSPLPGYSKETLLDSLEQLYTIKEKLLALDLQEAFLLVQKTSLFPSVSFGLESLLHTLSSSETFFKPLPLCALFSDSFLEIKRQIPFVLKEGYKYAKLKVSHLSFQEAHELISLLKDHVKIKIDVNRAWSLEKSLSFFSEYPTDFFEYIEEPVKDLSDLPFFSHPIALDETLREHQWIPKIPQLKALIIKPMLVGGLSQIQELIKLYDPSLQIIFSSSYESGIGLFHLCSLYERLGVPIEPLGVDTYRMIEKDLLVNPHSSFQGMLQKASLNVQTSQLKEIVSF